MQGLLLLLLIIVGSIVMIVKFILEVTTPLGLFVFAAFIMGVVVYLISRKAKYNVVKLQEINNVINYFVNEHIKVLHIKKQQKILIDEYGVINYKKWVKELDYFIINKILPEL